MFSRLPWRLIGYAALALLLLFGANHALGFVPFTPQWQARQLSGKAGQLKSEVSALEREAAGNAEIGQAVERHYTTETIIREIAAQAETEARNAPDATSPLPQERADRLRRHDDRMCLAYPAICPDPDLAGSGPDAVPTPDPAG